MNLNGDIRISNLLADLQSLHWDLVMVSEARASSQDVFLSGGHRLIMELGEYQASGVALLIHHRHVNRIQHIKRISDRVLAVDFKFDATRVRCIVVYIPHANLPVALYKDTYEKIHGLMNEAQELDMKIILGGDFNTQLDDYGRADDIYELMNEFDVSIVNPSAPVNRIDSWTFSNHHGKRIIDYIMLSNSMQTLQASVKPLFDELSHHRAVHAELKFKFYKQKVKKKKTKKGWRPKLNFDGQASTYHDDLDDQLYKYESPTLKDINRIMHDCATRHQENASQESMKKPWQREEIQQLITQRRRATSSEE
eukprot:4814367-Karenia_brevis.AAC.2